MDRRSLAILVVVALAAVGTTALAKTARPKKPPAAKNPVVEVTTSMGSFQIELYPDKAPKTVENFLAYVDAKFYDGTIFHRVIADFMIQGGGFDANLNRKDTREPIENEARTGLSNARGVVSMARTSDPNSATAQFFVNVKDNKRLDYKDGPGGEGYCGFGKVVKGMDVVNKIKAVKTGSQGGMQDVPTTPVTIEMIRRIR
jgi:cyclophilin family peptidyl-prolyl cis-trans isomerase